MAGATELVFHEDFHPDTVAAINEMREIRLGSLLQMQGNLAKTAAAIGASGPEVSNLKHDLEQRIISLKDRLANPNRIFSDELELYMELLANPEG
ncbi:MAG: hypothetical protein RIQ81_1850 [Pseudomonadota bacterium]|jgi:hypothetical protein